MKRVNKKEEFASNDASRKKYLEILLPNQDSELQTRKMSDQKLKTAYLRTNNNALSDNRVHSSSTNLKQGLLMDRLKLKREREAMDRSDSLQAKIQMAKSTILIKPNFSNVHVSSKGQSSKRKVGLTLNKIYEGRTISTKEEPSSENNGSMQKKEFRDVREKEVIRKEINRKYDSLMSQVHSLIEMMDRFGLRETRDNVELSDALREAVSPNQRHIISESEKDFSITDDSIKKHLIARDIFASSKTPLSTTNIQKRLIEGKEKARKSIALGKKQQEDEHLDNRLRGAQELQSQAAAPNSPFNIEHLKTEELEELKFKIEERINQSKMLRTETSKPPSSIKSPAFFQSQTKLELKPDFNSERHQQLAHATQPPRQQVYSILPKHPPTPGQLAGKKQVVAASSHCPAEKTSRPLPKKDWKPPKDNKYATPFAGVSRFSMPSSQKEDVEQEEYNDHRDDSSQNDIFVLTKEDGDENQPIQTYCETDSSILEINVGIDKLMRSPDYNF